MGLPVLGESSCPVSLGSARFYKCDASRMTRGREDRNTLVLRIFPARNSPRTLKRGKYANLPPPLSLSLFLEGLRLSA